MHPTPLIYQPSPHAGQSIQPPPPQHAQIAHRHDEEGDGGLEGRRLIGLADHALDAAQPRSLLGRLAREAGEVGDRLDNGAALRFGGGLEVVGPAVEELSG